MKTKYSVWRDAHTNTYEVVMWDDGAAIPVVCGIKTQEKAHKERDKWQRKEDAARRSDPEDNYADRAEWKARL